MSNTQSLPAEKKSPTGSPEAAIRSGVLAALGRPAQLVKVAVLPLWGNKYRVNVWTSEEGGNAIPNSYFVTVDERGAILHSEPPIQKLY